MRECAMEKLRLLSLMCFHGQLSSIAYLLIETPWVNWLCKLIEGVVVCGSMLLGPSLYSWRQFKRLRVDSIDSV